MIVAVSGGNYSGEYIAFSLPESEVRHRELDGASAIENLAIAAVGPVSGVLGRLPHLLLCARLRTVS